MHYSAAECAIMNREGECGLDESDTPQAATLPYLAGEKKLRSPTHKRRTSRGLIVYTIMGFVCAVHSAKGQSGPDVVVGDIDNCLQLGREGPVGSGTVGLGLNTTACNKGDENGHWFALPNADHPVISINVFRLRLIDGADRFE